MLVIVGASNADNNARTDSGSAYVIYGSGSPGEALRVTEESNRFLRKLT